MKLLIKYRKLSFEKQLCQHQLGMLRSKMTNLRREHEEVVQVLQAGEVSMTLVRRKTYLSVRCGEYRRSIQKLVESVYQLEMRIQQFSSMVLQEKKLQAKRSEVLENTLTMEDFGLLRWRETSL